jgi:hypothetical protein
MTYLVRLVVDDDWSERAAGVQLRERVKDESVLRWMRARVMRGQAERATPFGERAARTLDAALAPGSMPSDEG